MKMDKNVSRIIEGAEEKRRVQTDMAGRCAKWYMMGEIEKMETKVKQFTKMGVCL
jgi:hypothetical protein